MRFHVDAWDPAYGTASLIDPTTESTAEVRCDVETAIAHWAPVDVIPPANGEPPLVIFVDGVRRTDAHLWIENGTGTASPGLCASYAAGAVTSRPGAANLSTVHVRRGVFASSAQTEDVQTTAGTYTASLTPADDPESLSLALQRRLAELEMIAAVDARSSLALAEQGQDLLVVDGPLRGRQHLPRALGFIKTHRVGYLPAELEPVVVALGPGQRTPVFVLGTTWDRHSWYLRLPCRPGAPWAGIVRVECSADMPVAEAVELAHISQSTLCRYASVEYKDPRAPANLFPTGGLERALRSRLGDQRVVFRALQVAASR
jgi:hypothetical protein